MIRTRTIRTHMKSEWDEPTSESPNSDRRSRGVGGLLDEDGSPSIGGAPEDTANAPGGEQPTMINSSSSPGNKNTRQSSSRKAETNFEPPNPAEERQVTELEMQNNPFQYAYFPFPRHFRRKTTDVDMHNLLEIEILRRGDDAIRIDDPDRLSDEITGEHLRFPKSQIELAFASVRNTEPLEEAEIAARKDYLVKHDLGNLFDEIYDYLIDERPAKPKLGVASFLQNKAEDTLVMEERRARRSKEKQDMEAWQRIAKKLPHIPKAPVKVIEFKLEDEQKRHEAREAHEKK